MALPSPYVVELSFGSSGFVDVTSYVNSITIGKGISRQLDDYSAGTLSISFTNNDRTFDPLNISSILWYNGNTNLISNYDFETNITGWSAYTASYATNVYRGTYDATYRPFLPYSGSAYLMVVSADPVPIGSEFIATNTAFSSAVTAGQTYTLSAYNRTYWNTTVKVAINWYSASGFISQSTSTYVSSSNTSWKRITNTAVAPAGAIKAEAVLFTVNYGGGSEDSYWDYVFLQSNDSANSYSLVQPGGKIRVSAAGVRRFTGFIQDWDFTYDQAGFDGQAQLTALDEMFRVSNAVFTGGYAWAVESTSDRMNTVLNYNGFGASEYSGVRAGQTLLGTDTWNAGDNVLSYLQNVARSEPGDFYSNASAVMQFKDRSFTNYAWTNTSRKNYVNYPSTAVGSAFTDEAGGQYQWVTIGVANTAIASQFGGTVYRAGTVDAAIPAEQFTGFQYYNYNLDRYAASGTQYVFSAYLRGNSGTYEGSFQFLDTAGQLLQQTSITQASAGSTVWTRVGGTATYSGTAILGGASIVFGITQATATTGTAVAGEGFQIEPGTAFVNYFDGGYNPYVSDATNRYGVAWADGAYSSTSGLLSASATAISAPVIYTFADANSQGTAYGNGTGIPFMDLNVAYGGEQLYNQVQVVGVNATAVVSDTVGQSLYGLRAYSQTDNLTTSLSAPAKIAAGLLGEFRLPEYRATAMTVALEALTSGQQSIVLGLELRDVIRLCFQPSAQGAVVDKYYQILGVNSNTDVERDHITFTVASLDNLPIRLDSTLLAVLDTDTLA